MCIQRKCLPEFYSVALFWEVLKYHPHIFLVATIPNPQIGESEKGHQDWPTSEDKGKEKEKEKESENKGTNRGNEGTKKKKRRPDKVIGYVFNIIEKASAFEFMKEGTRKESEQEKEKGRGKGEKEGERKDEFLSIAFEPIGNIYSLAVLSEFRGMGIGKRLLGEAIRRLTEVSDCSMLYLNVRKSNRLAISLYEKAGFTRYVDLYHDIY